MDTNIEGGYVATGTERPKGIEIQFKDGLQMVPPAVVAHLGGEAALLKHKDSFSDKTYKEFMKGFWTLIEKDALNQAANQYINQHFRNFGF